jgi:ubiquinone/menaquinone biosynthesis C-methylase UbiE
MSKVGNAVSWNYSDLARPYLKRPAYSEGGLNAMLAIAAITGTCDICDIGAGIGHLTIPLADRGHRIVAVEPNDNMRELGIERTRSMPDISWRKGTGEESGCDSNSFEFVTFGSSFNVTNRSQALIEAHRILRPGGWFACMWNHRDLEDPIQADVEDIISSFVPGYDYGTRREDQTQTIRDSGLFDRPYRIDAPVLHRMAVVDWVEAWRSHATLARQAGDRMEEIVGAIEDYLSARGESEIIVPYITRIWVTRSNKQ